MTKKPTKHSLRLTVIAATLLGIFVLFFSANLTEKPLPFGLNKADGQPFLSPSFFNRKVEVKKALSRNAADTLGPVKAFNLEKSKLYDDSSARQMQKERVLLIGDSQLEGLKGPMNEYCIKNNHELVSVVIWYGSSTKNWATTDSMTHFIKKFKPTVVVAAIGLNEIFARDLEKRRGYIQTLKAGFEREQVKWYWVGPAAWTKDNGIIEVMQTELGDHFFPSHTMQMERGNDGRHPSRKAAKLWFDEIAVELTTKNILSLPKKVDELQKLKGPKIITIPVPKSK
jgi:hypothetical protein